MAVHLAQSLFTGRLTLSIPFIASIPGTFSLEMDLQVIDPASLRLVKKGADIVASINPYCPESSNIRIGPRQDSITLLSGEHEHPDGLLAQMGELKAVALEAAHDNQVCLIGGGSDPWDKAGPRRGNPGGFFGVTVRLGVRSGDEAIRLAHGLRSFIPHMIALSASSPFQGGEYCGLSSVRNQCMNSFWPVLPASIQSWHDYENYVEAAPGAMGWTGQPWAIAPRPDLGVVETRLLDASLTLEKACMLAGWMQVLGEWILRQDDVPCPVPSDEVVNRHQAALLGIQASYAGADGRRVSLQQSLLSMMADLHDVAQEMGSTNHLQEIRSEVQFQQTDDQWLRKQWRWGLDMESVVRAMIVLFDGRQLREVARFMPERSAARVPFAANRLQADFGL